MSSTTRLTKYISATTIVTSDVANMWYGGLHGSSEASLYDPTDPLVAGHVHDGMHADGHAQKIHLVDHVTDQITNPNVGDNAITPRNINPYVLEENAIPYITTDGEYKLDLSMVTPSMGLGAFIEVPADNLIKHTNEDYSSTGVNFVFGSSSLDDIGVDPDPAVIEDGDCRMLFDRERAAFRAGCVTLDQWDEANRAWGSAAIGVNNSALSDHSGVFGGVGNSIVSGSDYSVIVGGVSNGIDNSTHCFVAAGHDNQITNSTFSSIIAGCENYNGGTGSVVGGYGMELPTGAGSFVWGYDSGIGTEVVNGNHLFIIGTGAVANDEKYKLGVNTNAPHPAGEMGAHIVGSTDAGSSPLRLENLSNSDSKNALCVDNDGNVFISDHELCEECGDFTGEITKTYWVSDHNSLDNTSYKTVFNISYPDEIPGSGGLLKNTDHAELEIYEDGNEKRMFYQRARLRAEFASTMYGWTKPTVVIPFDMPVGQTLESITLIADGSLNTTDWKFTVNIFKQKIGGGPAGSPPPGSDPVSMIGSGIYNYTWSPMVMNRWFNFTFDDISDTSGDALVNEQSSGIMSTYYAQFSYTEPGDGPVEIPPEEFYVLGINVTTSFSTLAGALGAVLT